MIEDQGQEIDRLKDILEQISSHRVIEVASSLKRARECIQQVGFGMLEANVVVLDANLDAESKSGNDAAVLLHDAQEVDLQLPIIGNSASPMSEYGLSVTADANKQLHLLLEILDDLPEPA